MTENSTFYENKIVTLWFKKSIFLKKKIHAFFQKLSYNFRGGK